LFSFNPELNRVFSIIPRTSLSEAAAEEQKFQLDSGMTDPETAAALGKQLGAHAAIGRGDNPGLVLSVAARRRASSPGICR
jgi:hypothetical protein